MAKTGDIRNFTLDKLNLRVTGGTGFARNSAIYTKESVPTSGKPDVKRTKQNEDITSVEIQATGGTRELIIAMVNGTDEIDMSYTTSNGDNYTAAGEVHITDDDAVEGKMTLELFPTDGWTPTIV